VKKLLAEAEKVLGTFKLNNGDFSAGSVAAALETSNGNIFTGICIDIACGIGFCAEHSAITEMLKNRETRIVKILAISNEGFMPPCGRCREFIFQIDKDNVETQVYLSGDSFVTLDELLPKRWQP
jgi:cytidine deaminase